ncbi:titin homolog [Argopecten irradians]|uniref:titin homolog n=1 Tax=Argopecten irradians TaxID=31199 RepID=UPI0037178D82
MGSSTSKDSSTVVPRTIPKPALRKQQKPRVGTLKPDGTPVPIPPLTTKAEVLHGLNFDLLDEIALHAPLTLLLGTFWDVVEHLVITPEGDVLDDLSKARMFFRWMTSFDAYTIDTEVIPPEESPLEYFMKIQYNLGDHAHMFYCLCKMADVPCVVIDGMSKGGGYEIGEAVDRDKMQGKWNAVLVSGEWRLIDTFWAKVAAPRQSSDVICVDSKGRITRETEDKVLDFSVNEFFFLCDAEHMIHTHFPDDKDWQLMHRPVDMGAFERNAYVREQYHKLGLSIPQELGKTTCVINSDTDAIKIVLNIPQENAHNVKFKYGLLQTRKQVDTEKEVDMVFERFVRMEHRTNILKLKLRFPIAGKFLFDVYAADSWESSRYELVCTYIINVSMKTKNHQPFPDCPMLGWGPNPFTDIAGPVPLEPEETSIRTSDGKCQICVSRRGILDINHALRNVLMDEAVLTKHAIGKFDEDKYVVDLILPEEGEYALKIFASTERTLPIPTTDLLTFLVKYRNSHGKRTKNVPFPIVASAHVGKKDAYAKLGIQALTYQSVHVDVLEGEGSFVFKAGENVQLLCELAGATKEGQSRLSVQTKQEGNRWIFVVNMPIAGVYSLNIFAIEKTDPLTLHEVQTYIVQSQGRPIKEVKFTDDFGPDDIVVETIKTSEDKIVISVPNPVDGEVLYANISRRDAAKNDIENRASVFIQKDSLEIRLKSDGEYLLEIYEKEQENVVTTIARFTISKSPSFKTYTSDIDALVKMLRPQEKSRKFKNTLEQKRRKKAAAKKKREEELRKEKEEQKRKEEEAKKKIEKEKANKKHKDKNTPENEENAEEKEEARSISPDTLATALEIAKAAEQEEKEKRRQTTASRKSNRDSSEETDIQAENISPERLAAAVAVVTTAHTNGNAKENEDITHKSDKSNADTKCDATTEESNEDIQKLDQNAFDAALSIIAAVESKSSDGKESQVPNIDTDTISAAKEIIALANKEGVTGGSKNSSSVSAQKKNSKADGETISAATRLVKSTKTNIIDKRKDTKSHKASSPRREETKVSPETLSAATSIVAAAKQNAKTRHCEAETDGIVSEDIESLKKYGSSEALSSEVIAAAFSIVSSAPSDQRHKVGSNVWQTKNSKSQSMDNGLPNEETVDPETLAAAVALVVASKKHDEARKRKKRNSAKKNGKPQNTQTPRKSSKTSSEANTYSQDSIEHLNYTSDTSNLSSRRVKKTGKTGTATVKSNHTTSNSKSASPVPDPSSKKGTMHQKNASKEKAVNDTANINNASPTTANGATKTNHPKNNESSVSKADGIVKSQEKSPIVDTNALAAATAIIKAAGRTDRNSDPKQGSKDLAIKEQPAVDSETLKAAAMIVAAASREMEGDNKQSSGGQRDNNSKTQGHKDQTQNKNESEPNDEFDYSKVDVLSPVALAEASKAIAASIQHMDETISKQNTRDLTTSSKKGPDANKSPRRSFSPNTISKARAIVATSKHINIEDQDSKSGPSKSSKPKSSKSSSNEYTCVSPNTLSSALTIISASENHSKTQNGHIVTTSDKVKKAETKESTKQTKKNSKKVNVVSGRLNMNGNKGRKTSTTTTPRYNRNINEDNANDDDYPTDSSLDYSDPDSYSGSEDDSEEERIAEATRRKKSVAQAMKKKDLKDLVYQLQEFRKTKDPQDEALVGEATKMVSQLRAKDDLKMACNIREVPALERAIRKAKKADDGKAITIQIILASQLLKRLNRIERLSRTVLQINQNALTEMKKYVTPPLGVHESLHATFLLLGEQPAALTTWKSCQALLFKTGKENIMRRISEFDPKVTSKVVAATAKKIVAPYSVVQIRDASLGASAFYVWVKGMIGEIETAGRSRSRGDNARSARQLAPRSAVLIDNTLARTDTIVMMM